MSVGRSAMFLECKLSPARAVGNWIELGGHVDDSAGVVSDERDDAGVRGDYEPDMPAGGLVCGCKLLAVVRDGVSAVHQALNAMPQDVVELCGQQPGRRMRARICW
jgi:hypothetical protein